MSSGMLRMSLPVLLLLGCLGTEGALSQGDSDLPRSTPAEQGLDAAVLETLAGKIRDGTHPSIHSLLVVRHGQLVFEEYFDGWHADRLHELQSISKGIVSACVGIALGRGELESIGQTMVSFFPEMEIENLDDRKRAIIIGDVLRMSTGTDYQEGYRDSPHWRLNRMRSGWTEFWLSRPMVYAPGTGWTYDSGGVIALSAVFQKATGLHVDDYAARHLFEPLGIERYEWERNAEGHPHAGGGLHLRPRDLAKIGVLMLNGGAWEGRQVVPTDWVELSTRTKFRFPPEYDPIVGYAYLWWVFKPDPALPDGSPIVAGTGLGGQYLFWIPDHDMVVVVTGWSDDREESRAPRRFLYDDILRAVIRR